MTTDGRGPDPSAEGERLQKVLARAGVASRRRVEELIAAGRVRVDGEPARLGHRVTDLARIEVDGVRILTAPGMEYHLLNKPVGVVSTADDPQGRPTVVDLVPSETRLFPVGRLDADTEGLIVLTNDGDLTHRLTHPSFGIEKEYLVSVSGVPTRNAVRLLRDGVELDDGITSPAKVATVGPDLLRITIHEGRNRQIRRMCDAVGHPVLRLVRVRIGPLTDHTLAPGQHRPLTREEAQRLEAAVAAGLDSRDARSSPARRNNRR